MFGYKCYIITYVYSVVAASTKNGVPTPPTPPTTAHTPASSPRCCDVSRSTCVGVAHIAHTCMCRVGMCGRRPHRPHRAKSPGQVARPRMRHASTLRAIDCVVYTPGQAAACNRLSNVCNRQAAGGGGPAPRPVQGRRGCEHFFYFLRAICPRATDRDTPAA